MTDHFALLGEPRRPFLDADSLKKKFIALSSGCHPDKVHTASTEQKTAAGHRFAELNAAYNCLREPRERLRHLLELELGSKPRDLQQIPNDLADFFMEIGALCRQVDAFLREKANATSPLLQAQLFARGQEWSDRLTAMQTRIRAYNASMDVLFRSLDARWMEYPGGRESLLPKLEECWRLLSFFNRWNNQLQERFVRVAF